MKAQALWLGLALSVMTVSVGASEAPGASGKPPVNLKDDAAVPAMKQLDSRPDYWTPERYQGAKPMPLPKANGAASQPMLEDPTDTGESQDSSQDQPAASGEGQPPLLDKPTLEHLKKRLYTPDENRSEATNPNADGAGVTGALTGPLAADAVPLDVGFKRAYFSSQPLVPLAADREYPYSTTGRLFFHIPGEGNFVCSGSVIALRLILTAGHCAHSGSGNENGWFTNFRFVPAYRDRVAPFSTWVGTAAFVTKPWYNGQDKVPNAADYAMIEIQDQVIDGVSRKIGEVVGYLGYQTSSLIPNHAHLLGYPVDFDGGERMHQVTAQSFRKSSQNTVLYGSDMRGGSSGGPWIMNFGNTSNGQNGFQSPGRNKVIGVTSYGPDLATIPYLGSSVLDSNFTTLLNTACGHQAGNCQ